MAAWNEPASIRYQRRTGGDPVLEAVSMQPRPPGREFIMVCGMGAGVVWIRWFGRTADEARETFRDWLGQPWQTLTTDFAGVGVANGLDFKPSKIEWFNIAE